MLSHKWHVTGTEGLFVSQTDGWDTPDEWNSLSKGGASGVTDNDLGSSAYPFKTITAMLIAFELGSLPAGSTSVIHGLRFCENMPVRSKTIRFIANTGCPEIIHTAYTQFSTYMGKHLYVGEKLAGFNLKSSIDFTTIHGVEYDSCIIEGAWSTTTYITANNVIWRNCTMSGFLSKSSANNTFMDCYVNGAVGFHSGEMRDFLFVNCNIDTFNSSYGYNVYFYNTAVGNSNLNAQNWIELTVNPIIDNNGYIAFDSALLTGKAGYVGARCGSKSYSGAGLLENAILKNLALNPVTLALEVVQENVHLQAAAPGSITLNEIANGDLTGLTIEILSGTGAGQLRKINTYDEGGKIAFVDTWETVPDATSLYSLSAFYEKLFDIKTSAQLERFQVDSPYVPYLDVSIGADLNTLTAYRVKNAHTVSQYNGKGNAETDLLDIGFLSKLTGVRFVKVGFELLTPNQKY